MALSYGTVLHCERCGDTGLVDIVADGRAMMARCECDARRKTLLALKRSGMEKSVEQFRFDNFCTEQAFQRLMKERCERFLAQDEQRFLYIGGQSGCGKTHIGTAVCAALLARGVEMAYITFPALMNELKSRVNDEDYAQTVRRYGTVPLLYIDDFMKFKPTQADIAHAFEVINLRVVNDRITVITSERELDEIVAADEALGGRIKQMCGEFAVGIGRGEGRNWRLK